MRSIGAALLAGSALGLLAAPAAAQGQGSVTTALPPKPPATTAAEADAAQLNEQGLALYAAQDYRHALEKFIGAHALERDPNLLFNIARCYQQLGDPDAALEKYELFVATPGGEATGIERARAEIAALESARGAAASAPVSVPQAPDATDDWRWLTLGGSAAFVAVGATFYAFGARDHSRVTDLPEYGHSDVRADMTWRQAHALVHSGNTKKLVGGISLGLGGALAATAVALFVSADEPGRDEAALAVQPSPLRGGGALLLAGTFR